MSADYSPSLPQFSYLHYLAKTMAIRSLHASGILHIGRSMVMRNQRLALNYHDINASTLEHHLNFLIDFVEFADINTFLTRSHSLDGKPLAILTFDDGYRSFATEIAPLLEQRSIPAVWFVPTAYVGTDEVFWFDRLRCAVLATKRSEISFAGQKIKIHSWNRLLIAAALSSIIKKISSDKRDNLLTDLIDHLGDPSNSQLSAFRIVTPEQLKLLNHDLITVGSHSHTHPLLSQLNDVELDYELSYSKQCLESWIGRPVHHFGFPSGDFDDRILRAIKNTGYQSAWTTEGRYCSNKDDPYRMPRLPVYGSSLAILSAKIALAKKPIRSSVDRKFIVRNHFDAYAVNNRWGDLYNPTNTYSHSFLARRAKAVSLLSNSDAGKILDLGCGTGSLIECLGPNVEYFGIDNAINMVEQARHHAHERQFSNRFTIQTGDAQALPFEANYFDGIIALGLIEYFDEPEKVIAEAIRVIKPGGKLIFSIPLRFSINQMFVWLMTPLRAMSRLLSGKKPDIKHGLYSKTEFRELFTRFGCRIVDETVYNKQLLPYPFTRIFPKLSRKAAALIEHRKGMNLFGTGYLLACEKIKS